MKTEKNILIAFILNVVFSIFELIGGLFTSSVSILSDSLHDFGDALSIGISYFLEKKSKKKIDDKHTYGYIRYSVLGGMITSLILFTGSIFVIVEGVKRLIHPVSINYNGMIIFAIIGVVINLVATLVTREGESINQKAVNLHMLEDVLGWVVVLIGSILMKFTDISYIDSVLSILVALFIMFNAFKNLKNICDIFLEKTPKNIDVNEIRNHLLEIEEVKDIHHMHIRSIDGYNNFVTLHAVLEKYDDKVKHKLKEELEEFGVSHSTIEIELIDEKCENKKCVVKNNNHDHHHQH